ncbi:MAG TPA: hypothetical protein DCY13_15380 [Verrucomicrobiales bacterium]|nr:hypothetical protein [Verrucomicrobiales bacterium]
MNVAANLIAFGIVVLGAAAQPAGIRISDDDARSALVVHFARYTEWPAARLDGPDTPLRIGVFDAPHIASLLKVLVDGVRIHGTTTSEGRPLEVIPLQSLSAAQECHVLYFGHTEADTRELLTGLQGKGVLTVGEGREFVDAGGILGFELVDKRMAFHFNAQAMDRAGIRVGPGVIGLAIKAGRKGALP